ncbi:hypothetical protein Bca52824_053704 [Brassica carinata]|uniref:SUF system FeS cluster assembly SufBD core domain-containing protein n=1 Tax=Brassica carinata TaxID=52824 RepID=A0A8X7R4N3_BRACI|nr:hypothetical protein Bca52824_053704 [Brassica carinata]
MYKKDGSKYFQGNPSLDPTNSSLEAEAIALLTAVQQLGRLSYKHLHAAVVELYCREGANIKYSTVQKAYVSDEQGKGGIYNFLTEMTQVETGSAITWKYPSMVLESDDSVGEFYSVALTNNYQQADTGTTMIHKGKNTKSRIISKGISAGHSRNCYRGLVQVQSKVENAKSTSTSDSMLIADKAAANTYSYIQL